MKRLRALVLKMPEVATKLQVNFFEKKEQETHSLTSIISDIVAIPMFCPKCNKPISSDFEKKTYRKLRHCSVCQAQEETDLKISGDWEQLINDRRYSYLIRKLDYQVEQVKDWVKSNKSTYSSNGEEEEWGANHEKFAKEVLDNLADIRKRLVTELERSGPCSGHALEQDD